MAIVTVILPIFGIILIGWGAAYSGIISPRVGEGLSEYVFAIAVPALILSTLTQPALPGEVTWSYWFAYFGGVIVAWGLAWLVAQRVLGRDRREAILQGFAASQSNTVFVGVPLILRAYGDEGALPLFMLLAVHLPLMMGVAILLIEADGEKSVLQRLRHLAGVLARNAIFLALMIGLALKFAGIVPGGLVKTLIDAFGGTASTCALLAMGAAMNRYSIVGDLRGALSISVLKLLVHPLAVWVLAFHVFSMPPAFAGVATVFAAMPTGINSYLMAARYKSAERPVSAAVVLSTLLAMLTIGLWFAVLGRLSPG